MSKINAYSLKKAKRQSWKFIIEDKNNPDQTVEIVIREPDIPTAISIEKAVEEQMAYWFTPVDGTTEFPNLPPITDTEGNTEVIKITEEEVQLATALVCLQAQPEEEKYDVPEVIFMIHAMKEGMLAVIAKVREITEKFSDLLENPTGAVIIPQ